LALGIAGYIPKSMSKKQLADGIRDVLNGSIYVPAHLLPQGVQAEPDAELQSILARLRDLTPQQLRVLEMIREGLQNKQIAFELKVAETTVKAHVSEILRKLNVFSRTRAVILLQKIDFDAISSRA
jgi:DNA-binding NarL/FixJ family response regulator